MYTANHTAPSRNPTEFKIIFSSLFLFIKFFEDYTEALCGTSLGMTNMNIWFIKSYVLNKKKATAMFTENIIVWFMKSSL